eukprot:1158389-Pelagomonas_calceolata.AAC.1
MHCSASLGPPVHYQKATSWLSTQTALMCVLGQKCHCRDLVASATGTSGPPKLQHSIGVSGHTEGPNFKQDQKCEPTPRPA